MQAAIFGAGVLFAALVVLLILTTITGSTAWAVTAGAVGLIAVALCMVGGWLGVQRVVRLGDRAATLARNQRSQGERIAVSEEGVAASLDRVQDELSQVRDGIREVQSNISVVREESASARRVQELEKQVALLEQTVAVIQHRAPEGFLDPLRSEIVQLEAAMHRNAERLDDTWVLGTDLAFQSGRRPRSFLTVKQAVELFERRLEAGQLLEAAPLIREYGVLARLDLATLRSLYRFYKTSGYWDLAAKTLAQVAEKSGRSNDRKVLMTLERDIAVFTNPTNVKTDLPESSAYDATGPIVHVVGRVLPDTQSGFTLRTQYTARAQAQQGLSVAVVGQSGIVAGTAQEPAQYSIDGVEYYRLPGELRRGVPIADWLRHDIEQLAELARKIRPSVLHAHSDFQNALLVHAVGKAYGIPTVYESRGFWEESWLIRAITRHGWGAEYERLFATYGRPFAYEQRKNAEITVRSLVDRNITLANVMKTHILELGAGSLADGDVHVVPNAVDPDEFPVQRRDPALAAELGIADDVVTIGYISSMVEYEGIETLIDGFHMAAGRVSESVRLLLVGDGSHLGALKAHAQKIGVKGVIFTGAVPHSDVLRYYGMIDIFVVPRKKSSVTDLVTPLKPFEAFSTGRAVVLSNVEALQEIAEASGAAETFRAGYSRDLGRKLVGLIRDPEQRWALGAQGADWVRSHRTWSHNVSAYYEVYRDLGYRGPVDRALDEQLESRRATTGASPSNSPWQSEIPSRDFSGGTDAVHIADSPQAEGSGQATPGSPTPIAGRS